MEQSTSIANLLDNPGQIQVYFSDPFRRHNIVGNDEEYERPEDLLNILFLGFPPLQYMKMDEIALRTICEKLGGPVKQFYTKRPDP